ncbi:unnamed protein product [Ambrosiozyma monospora]|uniref:Unnamed protein product n=1 Tax=Ambrosiozyma monospora TaxID=43982 RepID=A0A9W6W9U8_AMBMO|nr:unnamed protein product [Ambrosiozyma monospora]
MKPETTRVINFSSTSIVELNLEYVICAPERGFSFGNFNSLEYLDLHECQVSTDFFSHLPYSLRNLSLCEVILISSDDGVKLPIGLERLEYRSNTFRECTLPLISNFNDLTQLYEVAVEKVNLDPIPFVNLPEFITNLPTQIKSLILHTECSPKRSFEDTMICRSAELLHSFTGLQYLDFECDCQGSLDLCLLPPLMKLKLTVYGDDSLSGRFPSTLKFLDLQGEIQSFRDSWRQYVMPLKHLIGFRTGPASSIDFRGLPFPKHLSYFQMTEPMSIVLDYIPDSITVFDVRGPGCKIQIDPSKGESVSSMKNRVLSSEYCKWSTISVQ